MPMDASVAAIERLREGLGRAVKGQRELIDASIAALVAGGHILVEGAPGLGKTLLARALAKLVDCSFKRVQCTPDLMPADLVGTTVYVPERGSFEPRRGPVFCDLLLADEVNRATPKTQSALLEAMQEGQVTIDGETSPLPPLFTCVATQNPIEMEGTYPLPEAQLDRFLVKVDVGYPSEAEELELLSMYAAGLSPNELPLAGLGPVMGRAEVLALRKAARGVMVDAKICAYAAAIVRATRGRAGISLGASPRAAIALIGIGRARALMEGRDFVIPEDIKALALPVLRHRIRLAPEVEMEGGTEDEAVARVLDSVAAPR